MQERAKRIGRPMKRARRGTRVALGLRVTAEIKHRLDAGARATGRTQSQEAERLIELAYEYQRTLGELDAFRAKARAEIARGGYARPQITPPPTPLLDLEQKVRALEQRTDKLEQEQQK